MNQKLFQIKSFFDYWLEAMDEHSLHSPFIFNFYKEVVKKENSEPVFIGIEHVRESLLTDHRKIHIHDLGAGSSIVNSNRRKVSSIAKSALAPAKNSRLYNRIIQCIEAKTVLELGTSFGITTMYLACAPCVRDVFTVEGCPQTASIAATNFSGFSTSKIQLVEGSIDSTLNHIFSRINSLDLILFDANHTYDATMGYYSKCKPFIHEQSILIFDDIHWSEGMSRAWGEIQKGIEVTLTIDLYDIGIVFFRKELEKENYVLNW